MSSLRNVKKSDFPNVFVQFNNKGYFFEGKVLVVPVPSINQAFRVGGPRGQTWYLILTNQS